MPNRPTQNPPLPPENLRELKAQARRVLKALEQLYPEAWCALEFQNPFQLLVATILSAQCTDKMVNRVTPALFERYPDAEALAASDPETLEAIVHPTGFYRAKAQNLRAMATALVEQHAGQVPTDLAKLTALPGVGRKTAHVVLGTGFAIPSGVVVDTHVKRLSYRLGLTNHADPEKVERDLVAILPKPQWIVFSHRMIEHGRAVCGAARPRCQACTMRKFCPRQGLDPLDATCP